MTDSKLPDAVRGGGLQVEAETPLMKMLGKLGWRGQCSCCNGPRSKKAIRAEEKRRWRAEGEPEGRPVLSADGHSDRPSDQTNGRC